ncbi:hypothetical protein ACJQWK_09293 [Exserohilum turcicum]
MWRLKRAHPPKLGNWRASRLSVPYAGYRSHIHALCTSLRLVGSRPLGPIAIVLMQHTCFQPKFASSLMADQLHVHHGRRWNQVKNAHPWTLGNPTTTQSCYLNIKHMYASASETRVADSFAAPLV